MNYLEFQKSLKQYPVFSINDIRKRFPGFDGRRLVEWQQKGYIQKLNRGSYCFREREPGEQFLFYAANKIYAPSYISLESALSFHSLIPEGVFLTTSVTTNNTASFNTPIGQFEYRHIKPSLFFGYKLLTVKNMAVKIASPEKALLDFFYFKKPESPAAIDALRLNTVFLKELLDLEIFAQYQNLFDSKIMDKRVRNFLKIIHA